MSTQRTVVFVAPFPTDITMRFVRAASRLDGVKLLGVVCKPPGGDDARLYSDLVSVENVLSTAELIAGVGELRRRHGQPDRIIGILEASMVQLAEVRAHFGIPGTRPEVAELFRDKSQMKAALTAAGIPVARNALLRNGAEARAFVEEVGFPIVLKPPAGMGGKATFRMNSLPELLQAIEGLGVTSHHPILAEEFLRGREFSFETITVGGKVRMHSISHYLPTCLEAIETPWIQWCCMLPRDISGPEYSGARSLGLSTIAALGLDEGMTHMEWFERPDGSLAVGEIAQRPPGANISAMTGHAHGRDLFGAWVRAVIYGEFDGPWERKYAVGSAFLRGMGRGRVASVTGIHEVHKACGKWIVEAKLPTIGAPKSDSYEGDGYIIVKDTSTDVVRALLRKIIRTVRVSYAE